MHKKCKETSTGPDIKEELNLDVFVEENQSKFHSAVLGKVSHRMMIQLKISTKNYFVAKSVTFLSQNSK